MGIRLPPALKKIKKIMEVNILPIIQKTQILLQNWDKLCLSVLGRLNLVKMILTLLINYITSMLPMHILSKSLKTCNMIVKKKCLGRENCTVMSRLVSLVIIVVVFISAV